jgi:hypothetical protein
MVSALPFAALLLCAAAQPCPSGRFTRALQRLHSSLSARSFLAPGVHTELSPLPQSYSASLRNASYLHLSAPSCARAADGLHRLADHIYGACSAGGTLSSCLSSHPSASSSAGAVTTVAESAAFPSRIYSDQGQLLDAPDRGFYTEAGGLNVQRVQADIELAEGLIPYLQQHKFTGFMFESSGVEDYINYDHLGSGTEVYAAGDPHRGLVEAWQGALTPMLDKFASEELETYIMFFDLMYPAALAARYNVSSVHSPDLLPVLTAKFRELFERLPALSGALIYVVDSWSPRAGYSFLQLWSSVEDMAATASLYYQAFAAGAPSKKLIFSLWIPTTPLQDAWGVFKNATPPGLTVMVNDGQGDFLWSHGINSILQQGAARDRALHVASDAFRQYDGWGRLLSSPVQQWAQRLQVAQGTGAAGAMCFAEWSPGNTWPDSVQVPSGQLLNWTEAEGYKSWLGRWNRYRISQLQGAAGLFSPSEANVAVLAALYWDPGQDPGGLTAAWARSPPLQLCPLAADLLAAAYNASGEGWMAKYLPGVDEYAIEWSLVFTPKYAPNPESVGTGMLSLFANATLVDLLAANARVASAFASAASLVQQALEANGTALGQLPQPLSNEAVQQLGGAAAALGPALLLAARKTADHAAILCSFRLAAWLNHSLALGATPASEACPLLQGALDALELSVPNFGLLYAEESSQWNVASADPGLDSRPYFFRLTERSYADWLPLLRRDWQGQCRG